MGSVLQAGFQCVVTPIAGLLSGDRDAYRYLPSSLEGSETHSCISGDWTR